MKHKIKVAIIDDSSVVREVLTAILSKTNDIQVIHSSVDPIFALDKMHKEWPDVIILDLEMPRMDGITFLRKIMHERPTPVIICSSMTETLMPSSLNALEEGAIAVISKPKIGLRDYLSDSAQHLIDEVRTAAGAQVNNLKPVITDALPVQNKYSADAMLEAPQGRGVCRKTDQIVAIGTSTGGTQALEFILPRLPPESPGIVIVQHMPEMFTSLFAQRLNQLCNITVKEAVDGERIRAGLALIAPGGRHLLVQRIGTYYQVEVKDGPLVSRHRPSVDVLFRSVAVAAGKNATGIILTGMGDDGARGLREMRNCGARTIAQNEASCIVFGMPKVAIEMGGAEEILSLNQMSYAIADL